VGREAMRAISDERKAKGIKANKPKYECGRGCTNPTLYKSSEVEKLFGYRDIGSLDELNGIHNCVELRSGNG